MQAIARHRAMAAAVTCKQGVLCLKRTASTEEESRRDIDAAPGSDAVGSGILLKFVELQTLVDHQSSIINHQW